SALSPLSAAGFRIIPLLVSRIYRSGHTLALVVHYNLPLSTSHTHFTIMPTRSVIYMNALLQTGPPPILPLPPLQAQKATRVQSANIRCASAWPTWPARPSSRNRRRFAASHPAPRHCRSGRAQQAPSPRDATRAGRPETPPVKVALNMRQPIQPLHAKVALVPAPPALWVCTAGDETDVSSVVPPRRRGSAQSALEAKGEARGAPVTYELGGAHLSLVVGCDPHCALWPQISSDTTRFGPSTFALPSSYTLRGSDSPAGDHAVTRLELGSGAHTMAMAKATATLGDYLTSSYVSCGSDSPAGTIWVLGDLVAAFCTRWKSAGD
ncbi:hypothetical protein GGX14DRAFT_606318, partial [Mycena pura]